jgi:uncharacterized protein
MRRMNGLDWLFLILLVVGGLNWGLVGLFDFDLVAALFGGSDALLSRIVYILVGLSAIYTLMRASSANADSETTTSRSGV